MYGLAGTARHYEVVLHATGPSELREVPRELFFCRDLIWHQQHLGLVGHVAVASVAVDGDRLYTTARFSDLVQRIARRAERGRNLFRGWIMLLNGIVHLAVELGCRAIVLPPPSWRASTDRRDQPALFERLYDRHLQPWTPRREACLGGRGRRRRRLVAPEPRTVVEAMAPTICINHDIERGLGHLDEANDFAAAATRGARPLAAMLAIERLGVIATYSSAPSSARCATASRPTGTPRSIRSTIASSGAARPPPGGLPLARLSRAGLRSHRRYGRQRVGVPQLRVAGDQPQVLRLRLSAPRARRRQVADPHR
jgi:hypothetical protein